MAGIASAIGNALFGKKKQVKGGITTFTPPDITYDPSGKTAYSAKTPADAELGNEYVKDPTNAKFNGVDPARFGFPADNTIAVGNPSKVNLKNSRTKISLK